MPDLSLCDREPIEYPEAVQSQGAVLVLAGSALTVRRASSNTADLLGLPAETLLGRPLEAALGEDLAAAVRTAAQRWQAQPAHPATFPWRPPAAPAASFWCSVHASGTQLVLDLEPDPADWTAAEVDARMREALAGMRAVRAEPTLAGRLDAAAKLLRALTGFERVMIYRFDPDDRHGEVIAEARTDACEPYLGLRYPASDIPRQARALYLRSPTRIVADVHAPPAPLRAAPGDVDAVPIDLSLSALRAVSPVHLEYLRNMGVQATLTGSLVCDGGLWGLVACHHGSPRSLPGRLRELVGWLAQDLATQIALLEAQHSERYRAQLKACRERVITGMRAGDGLADLIRGSQLRDVLDAVAADGVALVQDGQVVTGGVTPPPERCAALAAQLGECAVSPGAHLFATDCLSRDFPGTEDLADTASGVLMQPLSDASGLKLLCFRGELLQDVTWGGNPEKAAAVDADGRISPRKSFAAWRETVRRHARRWRREELESAREFGVLVDVESRRVAEQAVRDSEARFRSVLDNAPVGIFIKDLQGRYTLVNRHCEALLGHTNAEVRGKRSEDILPPEAAAEIAAKDQAVAVSLQTESSEDVIPWPQGTRVLLSTRFPLRDAADRVTAVAGISVDVTERRRAEAARDLALAKYQALFQHFPLGITVCDREGAIVEANPTSEQMLGVGLDEHTNRRIDGPEWSIQRPDGSPLPAAEYASVRAWRERAVVRDQEMVLVGADGDRRWLKVSAAPLSVGELGALVVYEDITERKRMEARREAEAALRESERRFRIMADELPVLVWVNDPNLNCTMVNKTYREYLGRAESACLGRQWLDALHPDDRDAYCEAFFAKLGLGEAFQGQCRVRRADGEWRWVETFARPVYGDDGQCQGIVGTTMDITDRKAAEDALRESHDALERHAEQLGRLTSALTLAEQRERERLAKVLHDHLQQLLVGAAMGVERVARRVRKAGLVPTTAFGADIEDALASLRDLLRQSVDAARTLVADLGPPILHDVGMDAALEWLARTMHDNHGLDVSLRLEVDIPAQSEDVRSVLFECVREALFNVVKHAQCEQAEVVTCRDDDGCFCLEVRDAGRGFDTARLTAGDTDGTGFGILAMRERLRCLGGRCDIGSSPGAGTRVVLRAPSDRPPQRDLPIGAEAAGAAAGAGLPDGNAAAAPAQVPVLLVDDHAMVRQGLKALLADEPNLTVVGEACDGAEALEQVARLAPRLVLMDYSMPRMDGLEATRQLRAERPGVCVIGLSMYQEADRAAAMLAAGACAYVDKTAGADVLLATIREQLPHCGIDEGVQVPATGAGRSA
jgi:PAS domain S-box-containing protein